MGKVIETMCFPWSNSSKAEVLDEEVLTCVAHAICLAFAVNVLIASYFLVEVACQLVWMHVLFSCFLERNSAIE